ncbi:MAG: hypothetical protein IKY41_05505 [Clostridia bacterium]|nr:hypothetical protein [Clostridia bacterium]
MTKISITKKDLKNLYKGKNIKVKLSEEQTENTKEQNFYSNEEVLSNIIKEIIETKKGA